MPKKKKKNNLFSVVAAGFVIALFVAVPLAAPLLTKNEKAEQQDQAQKALEAYQKQQEEAAANEPLAEVDENFKVAGDITTMQIIDLVTGTGQEAKLGNKIKAKYKGALAADGTVFETNNEGAEFVLAEGELIHGWVEGIPGMKVGGKRRLVIPSEKGYGPKGSLPTIPANADLVFEIELVSIAQ